MGMSPQKKALESIGKLSEFKLDQLSINKHEELLKRIDEQFEMLHLKAEKAYETACDSLGASDPSVIPNARKETTKLKNQMEDLEDWKKKIEDSITKKKIREKMAQRIGGKKILVAFEVFIMTLIVIVLALLIYDFTADVTQRPDWLMPANIFWVDAGCCVIFMGEFFFRLSCSDNKKYVWRHHWIDFVTSIPVPGEAQLARFGRFGRFARFLRLLRFLRFLRFFFLLWRGMDKFQDVLDIKLMKKTLKWGIIATILGALIVYQVEGVPTGGNPALEHAVSQSDLASENFEGEAVDSLPKAIWWSFTTVLTGGFGDIHNPTSVSGQFLTGFLVITGMVLVGVFTATLTSIFVGEQSEELERLSENIDDRLSVLLNKIDQQKDT